MPDVTNVLTVMSNSIREELPSVYDESLPEVAPMFQEFETTSERVVRNQANEKVGRAWQVLHLFATGLAGLFQYANPNGPAVAGAPGITGDQTSLLDPDDSDLAPFPNPLGSPHVGTIKRTLTLHRGTGNFNLPIEFFSLDALNATQIEQIGREIKGVAENIALTKAASLFGYKATAASGYKVSVLGRVSTITEVSTTNYVDIVLNETYGKIHNFRIGQRIDVVAHSTTLQDGTATDGTDVRNYAATNVYVYLVITGIDYIARSIRVVGLNSSTGAVAGYSAGDWGSGQSAAADDWIVVANCSRNILGRPLVSWGFEDWIAASGQIMGGASGAGALDLDTYKQFRSLVVAVNGPLTENVMNRYIAGFMDSYPGASIDTIVTTMGVTQKFLEQPSLYNNRFNYDRQGSALKYTAGWDKIEYLYNGKRLNWITSPMSLKSTLYGLKLANGNIKRYVVPRVGGSDGRVGGDVEFLAPLCGSNSIFMPITNTSAQVLNAVQAPFWMYELIAPTDVRSVKFTGLTESTLLP